MTGDELIHGSAGSNQHVAYQIRAALNPVELWGISTYSAEEEQWAIALLARAYREYDVKFLRGQLDGLEKLERSNPSATRDPMYFLFRAHSCLRRTTGQLPSRVETILLAKRIWAIARLTGRFPKLPLPDYPANFQRRLEQEIAGLPEQKWSRHFKALGLAFSPTKRGPKPKSPRKTP